ncbi:MAG: Wzz/FepE/Etk N-terminal domain-containing protein [Clostridia bacterium]|nr:Wzz/FepE/Etk N-terminal domain-containing protein [Clostridia bacterium]
MNEQITAADSNVIEIDLGRLFRSLWKNIWIIVIAGVLFAGMAFMYASIFVTPMYSSSVMLYVNNSTNSYVNGQSSSDLSAARGLVQTYIVVLKSPESLREIISSSNVSYSEKKLSSMISAKVESNTEVFTVTVTSPDPEEAARIASAAEVVLIKRVAEVVDGSSMRTVSHATVNPNKVSPNVAKYTLLGLLLGAMLACVFIVIRELLDRTIHEDDDFLKSLNIPMLTKIPDLCAKDTGKYTYYRSYGYGRQSYYSGKATQADQTADTKKH